MPVAQPDTPILRFTTTVNHRDVPARAAQFGAIPSPDWWPDPDARDTICATLRAYAGGWCGSVQVLQALRRTHDPDVEIFATAVQIPDAPWHRVGPKRTWVLYLHDVGQIDVIEYPDKQACVTALLSHVASRDDTPARYDYVVDPNNPRTALPPGLTDE